MADMLKPRVMADHATYDRAVLVGQLPSALAGSAMERCLQAHVVPVYDALKADTWRALSVEQVRARVAAERVAQLK